MSLKPVSCLMDLWRIWKGIVWKNENIINPMSWNKDLKKVYWVELRVPTYVWDVGLSSSNPRLTKISSGRQEMIRWAEGFYTRLSWTVKFTVYWPRWMLQLTVRFENKKVIKSTLLINVRTLKNYSLSYVIFNIFLSLKMIFSSRLAKRIRWEGYKTEVLRY